MVTRAFKYRFYPTPEQEALLNRTFGSVRYVYNRALALRSHAWLQEQKRVNYYDTSKLLTEWKQNPETEWLQDVSSVPLQQSLRHLQAAFVAFWEKRAKFPAFKSKRKGRHSATFTRMAFSYRDGRVTLAKCVAPLNIRWSQPLPKDADPSSVTVSRDPAGRWHISIQVEAIVEALPAVTTTVGIDMGITCLVALSTAEKVPNPQHERKDRARLALVQRRLSRKALGAGEQIQSPREGREGARTDRRPPARRTSQIIHEDRPRKPSGDHRGLGHPEHGPQPLPGPIDLRRIVVGVSQAVGIQGGVVWADGGGDRPVVSEQQDLLGLRLGRHNHAVERAVMDLPVWRDPRPGRERGEEHSSGRAGRARLRRWRETLPHLAREGSCR